MKINKGYVPTNEEIDRMNNDIEKYNAKYKVRMEQINKFNFSLWLYWSEYIIYIIILSILVVVIGNTKFCEMIKENL